MQLTTVIYIESELTDIEHAVEVEADYIAGYPAAKDCYGRPTECELEDRYEVTSISIDDVEYEEVEEVAKILGIDLLRLNSRIESGLYDEFEASQGQEPCFYDDIYFGNRLDLF